MHIVLHIGTEKTGTTSLQTWAQHNRSALQTHGVWVCESLGTPNNSDLAVYGAGLAAEDDLLAPLGLHTEADIESFRADLRRGLADEVSQARAADCHTFLISSEHLHSRIRTPAQVKMIADVLKPLTSRVSCVVFLRPQADLSRSVQSNHLSWGVAVSDASFIETAQGHNYDYCALVDLWHKGFGQAPLVVPYKRNPNAIAWMLGHLGLPNGAFEETDRRMKERASLQGAAILNALADILPTGPEQIDLRQNIIQSTAGLGVLTFSRTAAETITETYAKSNAALCETRSDITLDDLTPDFADYPEKGSVARLPSLDCQDGLRAIVSKDPERNAGR